MFQQPVKIVPLSGDIRTEEPVGNFHIRTEETQNGPRRPVERKATKAGAPMLCAQLDSSERLCRHQVPVELPQISGHFAYPIPKTLEEDFSSKSN